MSAAAYLQDELDRVVEERDRLRDAIRTHRAQKADDRCIEDDDRLYAALGDGIACDRRVGCQLDMIQNCIRFVRNRTEGGGWVSYAELEARLKAAEASVRVYLNGILGTLTNIPDELKPETPKDGMSRTDAEKLIHTINGAVANALANLEQAQEATRGAAAWVERHREELRKLLREIPREHHTTEEFGGDIYRQVSASLANLVGTAALSESDRLRWRAAFECVNARAQPMPADEVLLRRVDMARTGANAHALGQLRNEYTHRIRNAANFRGKGEHELAFRWERLARETAARLEAIIPASIQ